MNVELIKILDAKFKGVEPNINEILKVEADPKIKEILSNIFEGVSSVKYTDLDEICQTKFVRNLLYDYVDENKISVKEIYSDVYDNIEDSTNIYLREIAGYHVLTVKQEYKYGKLLKYGTEAEKAMAREKFVNHNQKLVIKVAKKFIGNGLDFMDLIQEGNSGLLSAIDKFDVDMGNKFSTYAIWWISQGIKRGIANKSRTIRIPVHTNDDLLAINRYESMFCQRYNHEPTSRELAKFMSDTYTLRNVDKKIEEDYKGCPNIPEAAREYYRELYKDVPRESYSNYSIEEDKYSLGRIIMGNTKWYDLNFEKDLKEYRVDCLELTINNIRENISTVVSYDSNVSGGRDGEDGSLLLDFIADENNSTNPELSCEQVALSPLITEVFDMLKFDSRTREVLRLRFGLETAKPKDICDICFSLCGKNYTKGDLERIEYDIKTAENKLASNPDEMTKLINGDEDCILSLYEKVLIELKYSITTGHTYTLEELSSVFRISRERVRQIEMKAIRKMKKDRTVFEKIKEYA